MKTTSDASTIKQIARFGSLPGVTAFLQHLGASANFGWSEPLAVEAAGHGNADAVLAVFKHDKAGFLEIAGQVAMRARENNHYELAQFVQATSKYWDVSMAEQQLPKLLKTAEQVDRIAERAINNGRWWFGARAERSGLTAG